MKLKLWLQVFKCFAGMLSSIYAMQLALGGIQEEKRLLCLNEFLSDYKFLELDLKEGIENQEKSE